MHLTLALRRALLNRAVRCVSAAFGLVVYSFGNYMQIQANIGLSPWSALNLGTSNHCGFSFGTASILISLGIIALDLLMREPIGLGTILDCLVVGWAMDFFLWANWVPMSEFLPLQLVIMVGGLVIMFVGSYFYMRPGLSCGPRDALLVALGKRLPRFSIGSINIALLAAVLAVSMLLGIMPGIGTAITILGNGLIMDLVFHCLRFEPRSVEHENLLQTWNALTAAAREGASASTPPSSPNL